MSPLAIFTGPYGVMAKWGVIALIALACMGFGAAQMHKHDVKAYDALVAKYNKFVADTKAAGDEQNRKTAKTIADNQAAKESADGQNLKLRRANADLATSLLSARASRGYLPPAAAGTARPELACFDRTLFESAAKRLDEGLSGLAGEGDGFRVDLDSAKAWSKAVTK